MNKLNKGLLIGNIVLVLVVLSFVLTACTSGGEIAALKQQDTNLANAIQQLQSQINTDRNTISQLQVQIETMQANFTVNFNNLANAIANK
jgi:hypothetical protein